MSEKIETYSPEVKEQTALGVEGAGEIEATKINQAVIIQRIAKDLYKDATSGLRELYMNGVRACKDASKITKEVYYPKVVVTMNETERTLIIEDNGIGITEQMFQQVLRELGTSSNLDGRETGQFGMGFASYMTLSSVVIIDTVSLDGTSFKRIAKDGQSFQRLGNADRKTHGTTLSMTCYDKVNFVSLCSAFSRLAKYSGVPTELVLEKFDWIDEYNMGVNEIEQFRFDEDAIRTQNSQQDLVNIETEDFHLIALVGGAFHPSNHDHIYLLNVPIGSGISLPFMWYVLNIKDERKFLPMPDRDRMRDESDRTLEGLIDKEIKKYFQTLDITNYQQFLDSDRKNEFLWLSYHADYALPKMYELLYQLSDCTVRTVKYGTKRFDDGSLIVKLQQNYDIIYQGYKNQIVTEKLKEFCPNSIPMTVKKTKKTNWKKDVEVMKSFGIPFARQILIDNKVKIPKAEKSDEEIAGHTNFGSNSNYLGRNYETNMIDPDDIDENVIRIDGGHAMIDVIRYVRVCPNPYTFVRDASSLDETDCTSYTEWFKTIGDIVCPTNQGAKTVDELIEDKGNVVFCQGFEEAYEKFAVGNKKTIVYGTDQMLPFMLLSLPNEDSIAYIRNSCKRTTVTDLIKQKYDVTLYSDEDKKFFCNNLKDIPVCFHDLFARLIKNIEYGLDEDKRRMKMEDYLKLVKSYEAFDENDELAKLEFFYSQHATIADDTTSLADALQHLLYKSQETISDNEYLLAKFMKDMALPKIFGKIVFKKFTKTQLSYNDEYEVSFVSYNKEFQFHDESKVFGFELAIRGLKFKVTQQYVGIKLSVNVSH